MKKNDDLLNVEKINTLKFVSLVTYTLSLYAILFIPLFTYVFDFQSAGNWLYVVANLACFSLIAYKLKKISAKTHAHILVILLFLISFFVASQSGGLFSSAQIWFVTIPSLASLMLGAVYGVYWMIPCLGVFLFFAGVEWGAFPMLHFIVQNEVPLEKTIYFDSISLISQLLLMSVIVVLSEFLRQRTENQNEKIQAIHIGNAKMASIGEMAASIAHEIKNPLAIISGNLVILKKTMYKLIPEKSATDGLDEQFKSLVKTVKRIDLIIKSMGKLSYKREEIIFFQIQLEEIVEDILTLTRMRTNRNLIDLTFEDQENLRKKFLTCDPLIISQIAIIIINNAVDAIINLDEAQKAVNPHLISIKLLRAEAKKIQIVFTDSGPGVPLALRDQVFKPFFTTKPLGEGTGVGLSLARKWAEDHGGRLWFNHLSEQSEFILELNLVV